MFAMNKKLLSLSEVADMLSVSKETLRRWDSSGKLVSIRHPINDYRMYKIQDLKKFEQLGFLFDGKPSEKKVKPLKKYKTIDVLINNAANNYGAGSSTFETKLESFSGQVWDSDLKVGLKGAMLCTKIFGSKMNRQSSGGNIINISSDLGIISPDNRIYKKNSIQQMKNLLKIFPLDMKFNFLKNKL